MADEHDVRAIAQTVKQLSEEVEQLKSEGPRNIARAVEPYVREVAQLKEDAARGLRYADEDRKREVEILAQTVKIQFEETIKKMIDQALKDIGVEDNDRTKFRRLIERMRDWMDAVGTAKKTGLTTIVTVIVPATLILLWNAFKGGMRP